MADREPVDVDLEQVKEFYDPHPGFLGAAIPMPAAVKSVADDLDSKKLPIKDAIKRIAAAAPGGSVTIHRDALMLKIPGDGKRHLGHMFRVIRFR